MVRKENSSQQSSWNEEEIARQIRQIRATASTAEDENSTPSRNFGFNHLIRLVEQRRSSQQQQQQATTSTATQATAAAQHTTLDQVVSATETGTKVTSFQQLRNADKYMLLPIQAKQSCFVLRRTSVLCSRQLQIDEFKYRATLRTRPTSTIMRLSNLGGALYNLFTFLYTQILQQYNNNDDDEGESGRGQTTSRQVQFHLSHQSLDGSISSQLYSLTQANRYRLVSDMLIQMTTWLQSSGNTAAADHVDVTVNVMNASLEGQGLYKQRGPLLPLSDDCLRRKRFTKKHPQGTVFYVDVVENCFFVACYYGLLYNMHKKCFEELVLTSTTNEGIRRMSQRDQMVLKGRKQQQQQKLHDILELSDETVLLRQVSEYFQTVFDLDIKQYAACKDVFMKQLYVRGGVQTSVFSDINGFARIEMWPPVYDPRLIQVYVLQTQYIAWRQDQQAKHQVLKGEKQLEKHFHGLRTTARSIFDSSRRFCPYCGTFISYTNSKHYCKAKTIETEDPAAAQVLPEANVNLCHHCARPEMETSEWKSLPDSEKVHFCNSTPLPPVSTLAEFACPKCKRIAKDLMCRAYHYGMQCSDFFVCKRCNKRVECVGQYSLKTRKKKPDKHDNCDEIFCYNCKKYVVNHDDPKRPNHVCYVRKLDTVPPPPAGIGCFDFEAYPCPDTGIFKVNCASLVYEDAPADLSSPIKAVMFTEVPSASNSVFIREDGFRVVNGVPYTIDIGTIVDREYIPIDSIPAERTRGLRKRKKPWEEDDEYDEDDDEVDMEDEEEEVIDDPEDAQEEQENILPHGQMEDYLSYCERDPTNLGFGRAQYQTIGSSGGQLPPRLQQHFDFTSPVVDAPAVLSHTLATYDGPTPGGHVLEFRDNRVPVNIQEIEDEDEQLAGTEDKPFCCHDTLKALQARLRLLEQQQQEQEQDGRESCVRQLIQFLMREKFRNYVFLAHFGESFDFLFVIKELVQMGIPLELIPKGNKILGFEIPVFQIRFLDFFCFVPSSLRNLGASFGITTEENARGKGFFPHLFNRPQHYNLVLPHHPESAFYGVEMMKEKERALFEDWYSSAKTKPFDFNQELHAYSEQDSVFLFSVVCVFLRELLIHSLEHEKRSRNVLKPYPYAPTYKYVRPSNYQRVEYELDLLHPFARGIWTLSGYANFVFRGYYLIPDSLAMVLNDRGLESCHRSSKEELECLSYLASKPRYNNLEYGLKTGKQRRFNIHGKIFYVDGYHEPTKTVVEYFGCETHGCPNCTESHTMNRFGIKHGDAYACAKRKINSLLLHPNIEIIEIVWSCEWYRRRKEDRDVQQWLQQQQQQTDSVDRRLHMRSAFRGGLVDASSCFFDSQLLSTQIAAAAAAGASDPQVDGQATTPMEGVFLDYNSLYPSLILEPHNGPFDTPMENALVPYGPYITLLGHQECVEECNATCEPRCGRKEAHNCSDVGACAKLCSQHHPFQDFGKCPGFALVRVLPPRDCRYPILKANVVVKGQEKNIATCCNACALVKGPLNMDWNCSHSDLERSFVGEYTTLELKYAVESQGYKLLSVFEIQYYPEFSCNVFAPLMSLYGKMKVVCKGFPDHVTQDENPQQRRQEYLQQLRLETGFQDIQLEDIKAAPASVTLSKLLICSVIGKMGQISDKQQKKLVYSHSDLLIELRKETQQLKAIKLLSESAVLLTFSPIQDKVKPYKFGSVAFPALVTSVARIRLVKEIINMEKHGWLVLYYDTDSLLVVPIVPNPTPLDQLCKISNRLGDLKIEHTGIVRFCALQAKTYCLEKKRQTSSAAATAETDLLIKAKGFNMVMTLLAANNQEKRMFDMLQEIFTGFSDSAENGGQSLTRISQEHGINIDPKELLPRARCGGENNKPAQPYMKNLNFVGPKRQILMQDWITFSYQRQPKPNSREVIVAQPKSVFHKAPENALYMYDCLSDGLAATADNETQQQDQDDQDDDDQQQHVVLKPEIPGGLLVSFPYGYNVKEWLCKHAYLYKRQVLQ